MRNGRVQTLIVAGLLSCTALVTPVTAQTAPAPAEAAPKPEEAIVITGSLNALPIKGVGSVFGFDKTLVETPRSASPAWRSTTVRRTPVAVRWC